MSSGKIASVLLGVTIFGSFALNGQVVKADTTTDGSQTSAAVDEAKSFNKFKNICVIVFLKCYKVCYNLATRW
ncbi:hypothetical protein CYJ79_10010 [Lactobacillus crispatus]|uniref:Uncharacterized protein n=1 Tax=Lactobacillus crispatus TaxID=47770 RepID=A0A2N5KWB2_9LACO|nr:hypothetical protein CYJ79_10010 [Lactobacillus crispatus]